MRITGRNCLKSLQLIEGKWHRDTGSIEGRYGMGDAPMLSIGTSPEGLLLSAFRSELILMRGPAEVRLVPDLLFTIPSELAGVSGDAGTHFLEIHQHSPEQAFENLLTAANDALHPPARRILRGSDETLDVSLRSLLPFRLECSYRCFIDGAANPASFRQHFSIDPPLAVIVHWHHPIEWVAREQKGFLMRSPVEYRQTRTRDIDAETGHERLQHASYLHDFIEMAAADLGLDAGATERAVAAIAPGR